MRRCSPVSGASIPQILEAHLVTGDYDYLVKMVVADTADYERFLREQLYRIEASTRGRRSRCSRSSVSFRSAIRDQ
jgi:Lrp/AsnC family leucine-responsive transcriptional regulator